MNSNTIILGIESSCDETAAAVVRADGTILAEAVFSQQAEHAIFGGVVPEIAARAHLQHLPSLVARVIGCAGIHYDELGGVAATAGPGLIGGLIVGTSFAKGLALAHGLPFLAINHLEAHALTVRLPGLMDGAAPEFPYLLLLLSGGHCQAAWLALAGWTAFGTFGCEGQCWGIGFAASAFGQTWLRFFFLGPQDCRGTGGHVRSGAARRHSRILPGSGGGRVG